MWKAIPILMIWLLSAGCATTHQYVPHRPFAEGKWEFSAVVHFDANDFSVINWIPVANLYGGLGKNVNIGIGIQPPLFLPTHLTPVKYFSADGDDHWAAIVHLNNIFSLNRTPEIEVLGGYFRNREEFSFGVMAGAAILTDTVGPLAARRHPLDFGSVLPVVKTTGKAGHWGYSLGLYYGLAKHHSDQALKDLHAWDSDIFYQFATKDVAEFQRGRSWAEIRFIDGTTLQLHKSLPERESFGASLSLLHTWRSRNDYFHVNVTLESDTLKQVHYYTPLVNLSHLERNVMTRDTVVIWDFPPSIKPRLRATRRGLPDLAIGLVYTDQIR